MGELLIVVGILGILAAFFIPKILGASSASKDSAVARTIAYEVRSAWLEYRRDHPDADSVAVDLLADVVTPYLKYVKKDTVSTLDGNTAMGMLIDCTDTAMVHCFLMPSGGMLAFSAGTGMAASSSNDPSSRMQFWVDPDGRRSGTDVVPYALFRQGRLQFAGDTDTPGCSGTIKLW